MDPPEEPDGLSLEESLSSLKRNAFATEVHLTESIKSMKRLVKSLKEEPTETPLQPRTRLMKWLTDRGLPVECSFQEFFEAFLQEHKAEHRLDLSKRTIQLNSAACILFGLKDKKPEMHVYDLLQKLDVLYY